MPAHTHRERGLVGDRLDLDHAITVLHPLALVPSRLVGAPFTSFA